MKKLMLLLFFLTAIMTLHAQDLEAQKPGTTQHLKFMGLEMGGNILSFVDSLKQKGFKYHTTLDGGTYVMKGRFAGVNDCKIMVNPNNKNNVHYAGVLFPYLNTWLTLYSNYKTIKSMLIQKYGEPFSSTEEFDSLFEPLDDIDKMLHVEMGRCKYSTSFVFKEGFILEQISNVEGDCYVSLIYTDKDASDDNRESAIDDL